MHSVNQCKFSGTRTCNRSIRGNHLAYAATQGIKGGVPLGCFVSVLGCVTVLRVGAGLPDTVPRVGTGLPDTVPRVGAGLHDTVPRVGTGLHDIVARVGPGLPDTVPRVGTGLPETVPRVGAGLHDSASCRCWAARHSAESATLE